MVLCLVVESWKLNFEFWFKIRMEIGSKKDGNIAAEYENVQQWLHVIREGRERIEWL